MICGITISRSIAIMTDGDYDACLRFAIEMARGVSEGTS